jgi:hypothetical protein
MAELVNLGEPLPRGACAAVVANGDLIFIFGVESPESLGLLSDFMEIAKGSVFKTKTCEMPFQKCGLHGKVNGVAFHLDNRINALFEIRDTLVKKYLVCASAIGRDAVVYRVRPQPKRIINDLSRVL